MLHPVQHAFKEWLQSCMNVRPTEGMAVAQIWAETAIGQEKHNSCVQMQQ